MTAALKNQLKSVEAPVPPHTEDYKRKTSNPPEIGHYNRYKSALDREGEESNVSIEKQLQERNKTLKIFSYKPYRNVDSVPPISSRSPVRHQDCISHGDSTNSQYLLDKARKDYLDSQTKKSKSKGTMFINELWGQRYKEKTIKVSQVNKQAFEQELIQYKAIQAKITAQNQFQAKRRSTKYSSVYTSRTNNTNGMAMQKTPSESNMLPKRELSCSKIQNTVVNFKGLAINDDSPTFHFARHSSLPKISYQSPNESPVGFGYQVGVRISSQNLKSTRLSARENESPNLCEIPFKEERRSCPRTFESCGTPTVEKMSRYLALNQNNDKMTRRHFIEQVENEDPTEKEELMYASKNETASMISYINDAALPPYKNSKEKLFLKSKNSNLNELIDKCTVELDDKPEWLSVISNMQGLFLTPKYDRKLKHKTEKEFKMINNCQNLIKVRMQPQKQ